MSRTEFFRKLSPFFPEEDIERLEDYGVTHYGCVSGGEFRGYDSICRLIYYAIGDRGANHKLESIIGRKLTTREYNALDKQMMIEW